jgi:hypothetical protein
MKLELAQISGGLRKRVQFEPIRGLGDSGMGPWNGFRDEAAIGGTADLPQEADIQACKLLVSSGPRAEVNPRLYSNPAYDL